MFGVRKFPAVGMVISNTIACGRVVSIGLRLEMVISIVMLSGRVVSIVPPWGGSPQWL